MLNTISLRLPAILLLGASVMFASDVTGKWAGTVAAGKDSAPISFNLHQTGTHVTGTVDLKEVAKVDGVVDGNRVRIETKFGNDVVHFELLLAGDALTGTGWATRENGEKRDVASVTLTRSQPTAAVVGITGTWSGTVESVEGSETKQEPFTFHLEQHGALITGDCSDRDGKTYAIAKGTIAGKTIVLELNVDRVSIRFDLTLSGNELSGSAVGTSASEKKVAKVTAIKQS